MKNMISFCLFCVCSCLLGADTPPTVATPPAASPNPVIGTTLTLSVLGSDINYAESTLKYLWTTSGTQPAGVTFGAGNGTGAGKNITVIFKKSGAYNFSIKITNPSKLSASSSINVTVQQSLGSIDISPSAKQVNPGIAVQYFATGEDQFGSVLAIQPSFSWSSNSGSISTSGLLVAGVSGGPYSVTATSGAVSGSATFNVNFPPTAALPAAISANPVMGTSANLSVLGAEISMG